MVLEDAIITRIESLIQESQRLAVGGIHGSVDESQRGACAAWLVAANHMVQRLCDSPGNAYRQHADALVKEDHGYVVNNAVGEMGSLLTHLLADAKAGLVASIADRARGEIFDNFLNHADAYAHDGRKNEAGVIAGVVFEDSIRRLCRKRNIPEKDVSLDSLISTLTKAGDLTDTKAKRARVAAHVRTKASHAQWDEFDMRDVNATIQFTREIVTTKLDT